MSKLGLDMEFESDFTEDIEPDKVTEDDELLDLTEQQEQGEQEAVKKTAKLSILVGVGLLVAVLVVVIPLARKLQSNNSETTETVKSSPAVESSEGSAPQVADGLTANTQVVESSDAGEWTKLDSLISCKTEAYGRAKIVSVNYYAKMVGEGVQIKATASCRVDSLDGVFEVEVPNTKLSTVSVGKSLTVKYRKGVQGSTQVITDIEFISGD